MALPVILFNASTGSDTAASGAGPGTALSGSGASVNGTTSIDLSADSPDLSGVATDGSAVLWVNTSSGRQFFKITAVDNGTKIVTVANAATPTESGKGWGIGGKRATLDNTNSRKLLTADALPGWTIRIENAGGTQSLTSSTITLGASGDTTTGLIILEGDSASTLSVISQGANAACITSSTRNYWKIRNLKFQNTNGTKTSARGIDFSGNLTNWEVENCVFGDVTNTLLNGVCRTGGTQSPMFFRDCAFEYCTGAGVFTLGGVEWFFVNCYAGNNSGIGVDASIQLLYMEDCIVRASGGDGINAGRSSGIVVLHTCTIDGNSGDGLDTSGAIQSTLRLLNTIFSNNGNYGVRAASGQNGWQSIDYCDFYTNTSGDRLNINAGTNDLAVDPQYTDRTNKDFSVGTNLKAAGFPGSRYLGANRSATRSYVDVGAAQRQESSSGGAAGRRNMRGNFIN